jgi:hypothetical protein
MEEQGMDQGPGGMARGRVNHQSGRFIQDQEVSVFIINAQRPGLRGQMERYRFLGRQMDPVA